jgi:hypothetical protein
MFSVTPGPFAVTDEEGNALCHGPKQSKSALNSARRRMVKAQWLEALTVAGMAHGTDVLCTNGEWLNRGEGEDMRDGYADFAHVIADANGGAYCICNAIPVEGSENRANGDARQSMGAWSLDQQTDYRSAVRIVAMRHMTKTKRSRVF